MLCLFCCIFVITCTCCAIFIRPIQLCLNQPALFQLCRLEPTFSWNNEDVKNILESDTCCCVHNPRLMSNSPPVVSGWHLQPVGRSASWRGGRLPKWHTAQGRALRGKAGLGIFSSVVPLKSHDVTKFSKFSRQLELNNTWVDSYHLQLSLFSYN